MKNIITEEAAKEILGIDTFRELSKDKFMSFVSLLPNMDPEVAKEVVAQVPGYLSMIKEQTANYREVVEKGLAQNEKNMENYYQNCNVILASYQKLLDRDDLEFDEIKYISEKMLEVEDRMAAVNTEDKQYYIKVFTVIGSVLLGLGLGAAALLGGNTNIKLPKLSPKS